MSAGSTARPPHQSPAAPVRPAVTAASTRPAVTAARSFLDRPLASSQLVLVVGGALALFGLVMVFSASSIDSLIHDPEGSRSPFGIFDQQAVYAVLGLPAAWIGMRLRPSTFRRLATPALLVSLVLLLLVLVPFIGTSIFGARRWLDLGVIQLQPSEVAKLAFLLWAGDLLVRKERLLGRLRHLLVPLVPVAVVLGGLVMLEPDLGTTLCFVLILFGLLWTVGARLWLFGSLFAAVIFAVVVMIIVEPYRMQRVLTFLDPFSDIYGAGRQSAFGMYALSTGGWWGVGLGNSRMKWGLLSNNHSDYIFAIVGEELGLLGCGVLLALFAALAYSGMRIARRAGDPFIRLISSAVVVWLVGQAIINVGYVVGLLPVTGIPLPLISSGGTSLVMTMFVIGMLAGFARHEPAAVEHLNTVGQGRVARLLRLPVPKSVVDAPRRRRPDGRDRHGRTPAERLAAQRSREGQHSHEGPYAAGPRRGGEGRRVAAVRGQRRPQAGPTPASRGGSERPVRSGPGRS